MKLVSNKRFVGWVAVLVITAIGLLIDTVYPAMQSAVVEEQKEARVDDFSRLSTWFKQPTFQAGLPVRSKQYTNVSLRYGNKTVNLCVLAVLAETVNKEVLEKAAYKMAVPAFCAVGNDAIASYLNSVIGFDAMWKSFVEAQGANRLLQEKAAAILGTMREGIRKAFSDKAPKAIYAVIEQFINENPDCLFMVRSTGLEDRVDMANAGGNESKSSVQPAVDAIWHAMGEVVESYFSEKSINQRLLAGDNVVARYFIPVLLQRMIGEDAWKGENPETLASIPVSGVMFTELAEATGSGVVQVQSAYGHNQGVVNSLVAVDTFYMGASGVIYPVIRKKTQRLVTMSIEGVNELRPVENYLLSAEDAAKDVAMQTAPSLSPALLNVLKKIADHVHKTYNHAMDIEFVVQGNTIYLVQARPLIHRQEAHSPSYVKDDFVALQTGSRAEKGMQASEDLKDVKQEKAGKVAAATVLTGFSIGVGGGYVRIIDDPAQVIVRDDIGQALDAYHANQQRNKVLVVIIKKSAPSTSHEATQFRSYGIPVMVFPADRVQIIDQRLNNLGGRLLLVDPQRGIVALTDAGMDAATVAAVIAPGWYTHPIPLMVSVMQGFYVAQESALGSAIDDYTQELRWEQEKDADDEAVPMRQLLAAIKRGGTRDALVTNLKTVIHRLGNFARQTRNFESLQWEASWLVAAAMVFACDVLYTFDDLKESKASEQEQRLAFLYPVKFLEALMMQEPDPGVVDGFSYVLLRKGAKEDAEKVLALLKTQGEALKKADPAMVEYAVQCMKVQSIALNDEVQSQWKLFVNGLTRSLLAANEQDRPVYEKALKQLATVIGQLNNLGILEAWLHTSFVDAWGKSSKAKAHALACIKRLIDEIRGDGEQKEAQEEKDAKAAKKAASAPVTNKEIIEWVAKQSQMVAACERRINEWSSPEQFNALLKQFGIAHALCVPAGAEKAFDAVMFEKGAIRVPAMGWRDPDGKIRAAFYQELKDYAQTYGPCVRMFNQAGRLGRLALLSLYKKTIDVFDRTIKAMTGSPQYTDKNLLAKNFATILPYYLTLMEQLLTLIPADQEPKLMLLDVTPPWTFVNYVALLRQQFDACYQQARQGAGAALLMASPGFSVAAAQLGSKVAFDRAKPTSLEDCFMLMHQNMLMTTAILNTLYGISEKQLPGVVRAVVDVIKAININKGPVASIVGSDYAYPFVSVDLNLPLSLHSSMFNIVWNGQKTPQQVVLTARFLGHNYLNRMNLLGGYANFASVALGIAFDQPPRSTAEFAPTAGDTKEPRQTDFSWIIKHDTDLVSARKCLEIMGKATIAVRAKPIGLALSEIHQATNGKFFTTGEAAKAAAAFDDADKKNQPALAVTLCEGLPTLADSFFTNTLFANSWFIDVYMKAGLYQEALRVIRLSLNVIVSQDKFSYKNHKLGSSSEFGFLVNDCVRALDVLMGVSDVQQRASEVLLRALLQQKLLDFIWVDSLADSAADRYERHLKRVFKIYEIRQDKASLSLADQLIQSPRGTAFWLNKYEDKEAQGMLDLVARARGVEPTVYRKQVYTGVFNALMPALQKDFDAVLYTYAFDRVIAPAYTLIKYAKDFPDNYDRAVAIARMLIDSKKVYRDGVDEFEYEPVPGYQYKQAGEIAKEFVKAGQQKYAHVILQALEQLRKEGALGGETSGVLDEVVKELNASLQ